VGDTIQIFMTYFPFTEDEYSLKAGVEKAKIIGVGV
jgi:hypothetical protein